jgi:2-oxoglutarate ferredoxin oxidoreductase subunit gamma
VRAEPAREDLCVLRVPCNEIAERLGDARYANMVMMGALATATGAQRLDHLDHLESEFRSFFPANKHALIAANIKAVRAGQQSVVSCR